MTVVVVDGESVESEPISQTVAGKYLRVTQQDVSKLLKDHPEAPQENGKPLWPAFNLWYWRVLKAPKPANFEEARARREEALAGQEQLKLATMLGELMTVADFRRVRFDSDSRVAARLKTLPTRCAPLLVGCQSETEVQARIDPVVKEVMEELYRAEDVPATVDEEAA